MFVTVWRLCALILISIYISGLVAALSTEQISLSVNNLNELATAVSKGEYKVCIDANTAFHGVIMVSELNTVVTVASVNLDLTDLGRPK